MSANSKPNPRGLILQLKPETTGYRSLVLDNGPFRTVTIHCNAEDLGALLDTSLPDLVNHLRTRQPGHFRVKRIK